MESLTKRIKIDNRGILLKPIGDVHLGSRACEEKKFRELLRWVESKDNCYVIGMGDYVDAILRTDLKRFDASCTKEELNDMLDSMLNEQRDMIVKYFKPIAEKGRLLGLLEGNHEEGIKKRHQYDLLKDICRYLDVPYLGYSCLYRLRLQTGSSRTVRTCDIWAHHGHGGGRRGGASINRLEDVLPWYEANIYLMGHDHRKWGTRAAPRLYMAEDGKIKDKPRVMGRTGSFLKTSVPGYTTYSEKANYPPVDLGTITIHIKFQGHEKKLDIHVSE